MYNNIIENNKQLNRTSSFNGFKVPRAWRRSAFFGECSDFYQRTRTSHVIKKKLRGGTYYNIICYNICLTLQYYIVIIYNIILFSDFLNLYQKIQYSCNVEKIIIYIPNINIPHCSGQ